MTAPRTLFEKIWDSHVVRREDDGTQAVLPARQVKCVPSNIATA
jgi:hypothetical protein